jgi:hypothetical protein
MNRYKRALGLAVVLGLGALSLEGCVYYPAGYAYAPGYYAPVVVARPPPVVVVGGWR